MPLGKDIKYRVKQTSKGPVRLAFKGNSVVEAKNMKTGAVHTPSEFKADKKSNKKKSAADRTGSVVASYTKKK